MDRAFTHLTLSPLDHIAPWNIPKSVIYLSLKSGVTAQDSFARLQEGLRRTLIQLPWLNGRVHLQSNDAPGWRPGQLEIRYKPVSEGMPHQLGLHNLDTKLTFDDIKDQSFPLDMFDDETLLCHSPFEPDFEGGVEVLAAQANYLPGGCALVLSVAAPASDGSAMLSVTRIWADHCCSLTNNMGQHTAGVFVSSEPNSRGCERAFLKRLCEKDKSATISSQIQSEIWRLVGLDEPTRDSSQTFQSAEVSADARSSSSIKMKPSLFYIPQSAYIALRTASAAKFGTQDISGNFLVCALIWRGVVRAWKACQKSKHTNDSAEKFDEPISEVAIPFDARPDFLDILPANFLGNLNFENRFALPIAELVAEDIDIPQLANTVRTYATSFTSRTHLLQSYTLLSSVEDYRELPQMRASRMKSASVGIFSPMTLPFNKACFGAQTFGNSGRPEAFRPLMGRYNSGFRTCFVMPRKSHGGIEFVMTLSEREREFLCNDEEFASYALSMT